MANFNNDKPVNLFTKEYERTLSTVFGCTTAFQKALAPIQIKDGISMNEIAFSVKTNNTPVVIGEYNEKGDVNKGVNRFGDATEIVYADEDVPYDYTWSIHEMLDLFTVNNDPEDTVDERLVLQAEAKTRLSNTRVGKKVAEVAGKTVEMATVSEAEIHKVFNEAREYLRNMEVVAPVSVYMTPSCKTVFDELKAKKGINGFTTTFDVIEESERYFPENVAMLIIPDGVVSPFVGIEVVRTIVAHNHTGHNLQGAGKGGTFVLDDNKKAIIKVTTAPSA